MIFESHAHYDDEAFDEDRETLLASMQENGIEYIVNVGARSGVHGKEHCPGGALSVHLCGCGRSPGRVWES